MTPTGKAVFVEVRSEMLGQIPVRLAWLSYESGIRDIVIWATAIEEREVSGEAHLVCFATGDIKLIDIPICPATGEIRPDQSADAAKEK
jgi:hypothetical protein